MFLLIVGLIYILFFILGIKTISSIIRRIAKNRSIKIELFFILLFSLLCIMPVFYVLFSNNARNIVKFISNQSLIIMVFAMIGLFSWFFIDLILSKIMKNQSRKRLILEGNVIFIVVLFILVLGFVGGNTIRVTNYDINRGENKINIVLLSDTHFGVNTFVSDTQRMVETINDLDADLVLFAGDIFDNDYYGLTSPDKHIDLLKKINSKYGTYAVWGNHDLQEEKLLGFSTEKTHTKKEGDDEMYKFLSSANIIILEDSLFHINDSLVLIGRQDYIRGTKMETGRKEMEEFELSSDQTYIVLDHEPLDYEEVANAGVSLILSGHTHNGQLFPGNLLTKLFWKNNSYGYSLYNQMASVVSSGYGVWGPKFRLLTKKEIVQISFSY